MLSRVADSLYWMSRYLERAEHTTRLLDVNLNLMLDESAASADRRWQRFRALTPCGRPRGSNCAQSCSRLCSVKLLTLSVTALRR